MIDQFPDAGTCKLEEVPVTLDTTDVESDTWVSEFVSTADGHLPGSTPHCKDSTKSDSANHALIMETPITSTDMTPVTSTGNNVRHQYVTSTYIHTYIILWYWHNNTKLLIVLI